MKRFLLTISCSFILTLAAVPLARADDEVRYIDPATNKEAKAAGTIQSETAGGIAVKLAAGPTKQISAKDIVDVEYQVPISYRLDLRKAITAEATATTDPKDEERQKALPIALSLYRDVLSEVTDEKPKRLVAFKIGKLMALQALQDPSTVDAAIAQLTKFKSENPDCWELLPATDLLAQLQIVVKKDLDGAQKTYEGLAATPGIPKDFANYCDLKVAQVMLKAKKYADAQNKIDALLKSVPATDPQAVRLQIYRSACVAAANPDQLPQAVKDLQGVIANTQDSNLKALAYNTLGDVYYQAGKLEDARWQYLWVDVIYHQDRDEHAKALYYLYKIFKELKPDDLRAAQCRNLLEKDPQFAGTDYQRLIATEK